MQTMYFVPLVLVYMQYVACVVLREDVRDRSATARSARSVVFWYYCIEALNKGLARAQKSHARGDPSHIPSVAPCLVPEMLRRPPESVARRDTVR